MLGRILLACVILFYPAWCGALMFYEEQLVFPRSLVGAPMPEDARPEDLQTLTIEVPGTGTVEAWFLPAYQTSARPEPSEKNPARKPAVIFAHGNGELIDHCTDYADEWCSRGYHVLIPEYRGYGRSAGRPSEKAIVADYVAFYDLLAKRPDVDPARIVFHGRSLGSAVVTQLGMQRRAAAIVLESPFLSITAFAKDYFVPAFIVRNPFRTDRALPRLGASGVPILILHSTEDEIVPYSHGQKLAELTPNSRLVDLSGSHVSSLLTLNAYWGAIDDLLDRAGLPDR